VIDDRADLLEACHAHVRLSTPAPDFIAARPWRKEDALVLVSRNFTIDGEALAAALAHPGAGYVGMIGSTRKVRQVFDELRSRGARDAALAAVYAPIGLDLGADSPAEIAVSVLAEILGVMRGHSGGHLRAVPIAE
jgi:xanthine dehydrogenase accessory factor